MQLILILIAGCIFGLKELWAESYFNGKSMVYQDSDNVTIWESLVLYQTDLNSSTQISVQYGYDSVTSASLNATSGASTQSIKIQESNNEKETEHDEDEHDEETQESSSKTTKDRHSGSLSLTHAFFDTLKGTSSLQFSTKSDYKSITFGQNFTLALGSQTTLGIAGYGTLNKNSPNSGTTNIYLLPPQGKNLDSHQLTAILSLEQILTPLSKIKLLIDAHKDTGYLSSGYQQVPIDTGTTTGKALEVLPSLRTGGSVSLLYSQWIGEKSALHLKARYHTDSYDLNAYSAETRYRQYLDDNLIWECGYRYYHQNQASFWGNSFATIPTVPFTNQYALSTIDANNISTGLRYETNNIGSLNVQLSYYTAKNLNFFTISLGLESYF